SRHWCWSACSGRFARPRAPMPGRCSASARCSRCSSPRLRPSGLPSPSSCSSRWRCSRCKARKCAKVADNADLTLLRYGGTMDDGPMSQNTVDSVEQVLRDELAHGDAMLATARPILRHLLVNDDNGLFSDEMIARIRGMMLDVAAQLLFAEAEAREAPDCAAFVGARQDDLAPLLFEDAAFLAHAHAVALEAQLAERLQARSGVDSALSPLVQAQVAGKDAGMAALAMAVLAAQARFLQHFRRMELPLRELPGDLFHRALLLLRSQTPDDDEAAATEQRLRAAYDEGASRLGLIARLVMGLGAEAGRALSIDHAGLAI